MSSSSSLPSAPRASFSSSTSSSSYSYPSSTTSSCLPTVASMSLGLPGVHSLQTKFRLASRSGFRGIEISHDDIIASASTLRNPPRPSDELTIAHHTRHLCAQLHLEVVCLQPLRHFEGQSTASGRDEAFARLEHWFKLARALGTDMLLVPSSFLPKAQSRGDVQTLARDLREAADRAATAGEGGGPVRIAYEALGWGTWVDTWERAWEVVRAVDRRNLGMCLDTFNVLGRIWADPTVKGGKRRHGDDALAASLLRMSERVDPEKLFFIQVVDGERLERSLRQGHEFWKEGMAPLMAWSRNCRLFFGEESEGGYLPVRHVLDVIFEDLGWRGPVSMELFNRRLADESAKIPMEFARRAWESWVKIEDEFGLGK